MFNGQLSDGPEKVHVHQGDTIQSDRGEQLVATSKHLEAWD
jgi:hypothetical protein